MEFYKFTAKSINGESISMEKYKGKTVLVVNTASNCGFTPQFEGLENLYKKYKDHGLVILGFPCNQFLNQEPGDEESIKEGCMLNYGVTFQMFSKIDVNGPGAHPLFVYLKKELKGILGGTVEWNFTKFLIDTDGKPVKRFAPVSSPDQIDRYLARMLSRLNQSKLNVL